MRWALRVHAGRPRLVCRSQESPRSRQILRTPALDDSRSPTTACALHVRRPAWCQHRSRGMRAPIRRASVAAHLPVRAALARARWRRAMHPMDCPLVMGTSAPALVAHACHRLSLHATWMTHATPCSDLAHGHRWGYTLALENYLRRTRRVLHRLGLGARLLRVVWGKRVAHIPSISASKSSSDLAGRASRRRLAFALRLARALLDGLGASGATTGAWAGSTTTSILSGRSAYVSRAANTYCHQ